MKVRIADLPMYIDCADKNFFAARFREYIDKGREEADTQIYVTLPDVVSPPAGVVLEEIRQTVILEMENGRRCRYMRSAKSGNILFCAEYTPDYTYANIQIRKSRAHPVFSLTDFEYMYTGEIFSNRLTYLGGILLHGSAIEYKGRGIVFSANSGVGKSTHTGLWKERFGNEVTIINDDKPAIRFNNNSPYIYGTPWSGKSDLNTNVKAPLGAVVFLERAEENTIRRISTAESIYNLISQTVRPYHDAKLGEKTLDIIERLISTTPFYMLSCDSSKTAVQSVYDAIIRKEACI